MKTRGRTGSYLGLCLNFQKFRQDSSLSIIEFKRGPFTWCNNRSRIAHIVERSYRDCHDAKLKYLLIWSCESYSCE